MYGRHRETTDGSFDQACHLDYRTYPDPGISVGSYDTLAGRVRFKAIDDNLTPHYKALLKCGKFLPLNPMQVVTVDTVRHKVHWDFASLASGWKIVGDTCGDLGIPRRLYPDAPDSAELDGLVLDASSRASSATLDVLTELFQARQDLELMRSVAHAFNSKVLDLAKEAIRSGRKNPWKRFRELWLEERFGIRPMCYLFRDMAKAYSKFLNSHVFNVGKAASQFDISTRDLVTGDNGYQAYMTEDVLEGKLKLKAIAYVEHRLSNILGFDPFVTAWELTRYSFVVDWFINVSGWVSTLRPRLTGQFLGAGDSWAYDVTYTRTFTSLALHGDGTGSCPPVIWTEKTLSYTREPASVPFPSFNPNLNWAKVVDLAALFVTGREKVFRLLGGLRPWKWHGPL